MERRGGCCIARYGMHNKVDSIMLKYRPIAPKPPVSGLVSSPTTPENSDAYVKIGRGKRKYVRDNINKSRKKKAVVTLPLLPESPEPKEVRNNPIWLNFGDGKAEKKESKEICNTASCVVVEGVTEMWGDGVVGMGKEEIVMRLERDTCPGFITDGEKRVLWVNKTYREMGGQVEGGMYVRMKECVRLGDMCQGFTCRVRWSTWKRKRAVTLPCDVWRINGVGFAWRLDVNAALCLAL